MVELEDNLCLDCYCPSAISHPFDLPRSSVNIERQAAADLAAKNFLGAVRTASECVARHALQARYDG